MQSASASTIECSKGLSEGGGVHRVETEGTIRQTGEEGETTESSARGKDSTRLGAKESGKLVREMTAGN